MRQIRLLLSFSLLFVLLNHTATAAEISVETSIEAGSITINEVSYSRLALTPTLAIDEHWLFALMFNLDFDLHFGFRKGQWDTWQSWINKIKLIRYGRPGDDFYLRIGTFPDISIGYGAIMRNFANNVFEPATIIQGGFFNWNLGQFTVEYFTENILDADIHITRFSTTVFKWDNFFMKELILGGTIATDVDDQDPYKSGQDQLIYTDNKNSEKQLMIYGLDMEIPFDIWLVRWTLYASFNQIQNKGNGFSLGMSGQALGLLNWKLEYKRFSKEYLSPYFDKFYLTQRKERYSSLTNQTTDNNGILISIWRSFNISETDDLSFMLTYQRNQGEHPKIDISVKIKPPLLLKKFEIAFDYSRNDVSRFSELFKVDELKTMIKLNFKFILNESSSLELSYNKSFLKDDDGNPQGQESTTLQGTMKL